ncbi:ABC transporter permease [Bailinhaonella thermotolerans]|uniref:ABC transporter permease n=1 Tax=Bailinhaonella thermotolerans TaxID=1070861 RepID=A0A3A4AV62_9ACTN|nr:ABC transporter permease [Bailinhaonella thermotolerans]RJL31214.1 ABC transporter permease [Bailinhaonella thermotolerans]
MTSLALAHAKYGLLEVLRTPALLAVIPAGPAAGMFFFVVPNVGGDPAAATAISGSMATFTALITCLVYLGIQISETRNGPWYPYLRTLPAGPAPGFAGLAAVSLVLVVLLAAIPVGLIAALFTPATASPARLLLALGALTLGTVPFALLSLAIAHALPPKAATAVANVVMIPLAFGGGLFHDPRHLPEFIETISPYLPTRSAAELVWSALLGTRPAAVPLISLAAWTLALAAAALWAHRRDETRRFR